MKFETTPSSRAPAPAETETFALALDPIQRLEQWLVRAAAVGIANYNACNLATSEASGDPNVRVVLIREIAGRELIFYTHRPSPKVTALELRPQCAGVFFWDSLLRQVRFRGCARLLDRTKTESYFFTRPREAQIAAHVSRQSELLSSKAELELQFQNALKTFPEQVTCPESFVGFAITVSEIEFWQQGAHRLHDRNRYRWDDTQWVLELLYP